MMIRGEGQALFAFHAALAAVESVSKSESADMGKYTVRYASLNAVHAECQRACELHRLAVCQEPTMAGEYFAVRTTLIHEDGSMVEFDPMCLPLPRDAQALGSATTYLRRYSLVALFGLAVEDDDGRAATVAAQTQPGRRTEAERLIRESIAMMDSEMQASFQSAFKAQFGMGLSQLPANRHGDALTWSREWTYEPPLPDNPEFDVDPARVADHAVALDVDPARAAELAAEFEQARAVIEQAGAE